jgi:DNA polymerase IV
LDAKKLFFIQLSALNENSDEEHSISSVRDVLGRRKKLPSDPSFSTELATERIRIPFTFNNVLGLSRTTSAPVPGNRLTKETPLVQKASVSRHSEPATLLSSGTSVIRDTPEHRQTERAVSNPTLETNSLGLNYSTGIESMLGKRNRTGSMPLNGKKKLRRGSSGELVAESEQIFKGLIFYYIPPDDKSKIRRIRINKARKFGATWTREFIPNTTHVVVDKGLTFNDVMTFLKLEILPSNINMVSEEYPIDSIESRFLLDPRQKQYAVCGYQEELTEKNTVRTSPQTSDRGLELKASESRPGTTEVAVLEQSRSRSEETAQAKESKEAATTIPIDSSQNIPTDQTGKQRDTAVVDSSQQENLRARTVNDDTDLARLGDDLEKMIRIARSMEDMPINDEEDDREDDKPPSRPQSDESGSDDESRRPPSRNNSKSMWNGTKGSSFTQQSFACMTGGTGITTESNPNSKTIEILQKMADYYVETKDHGRQTAYRKTIGVLRKQTTKISSYDEAIRLPTIGHRLALKIEEIVLTNGLRRLTDAMSDPKYHTLENFLNIYGVGISQAWKWVQQGHTNLKDLQAHVTLTKNQQLGIEHYDDLLTRIPRDEVTSLGNVVKAAATSIDPKVEVIVGGSYRRGASSSGDIDFILTKPSTTSTKELLGFLTKLTNHLTDTGFLVAALSTPSQTGSKWHGCCVLPGIPKPIWRRIDLLLVPESELGAALIYFTGDDIFNRSIRLLASKKGWRLNQRGLYKNVLRGPGRVKLNEGSLIEGKDEKKIFAALGVPWRPPEQRICQ